MSDYYIPEIDFTVPKGMLVQLANAMEDEKYFENPLVILTKNIVLTYLCMYVRYLHFIFWPLLLRNSTLTALWDLPTNMSPNLAPNLLPLMLLALVHAIALE